MHGNLSFETLNRPFLCPQLMDSLNSAIAAFDEAGHGSGFLTTVVVHTGYLQLHVPRQQCRIINRARAPPIQDLVLLVSLALVGSDLHALP